MLALCSQWWLCCHNNSSNSHYQLHWSSISWSTLPFSPGRRWVDQQRFYRRWGNYLWTNWLNDKKHSWMCVFRCWTSLGLLTKQPAFSAHWSFHRTEEAAYRVKLTESNSGSKSCSTRWPTWVAQAHLQVGVHPLTHTDANRPHSSEFILGPFVPQHRGKMAG